MRHGKGIMRFADGRQYRGKWRLDLVLAPLPSLACPDHSATARAPSPAHAARALACACRARASAPHRGA